MKYYDVTPFPYNHHMKFDVVNPSKNMSLSLRLIQGLRIGEDIAPIPIKAYESGVAPDFTLTPVGVVLLSSRAVSLLVSLSPDDVQLFGTVIKKNCPYEYRVANVLACDCVTGTTVGTMEAPDGRTIPRPIPAIDPIRVGNRNLFRIDTVRLIVTQSFLDAMESQGLVGPHVIPID